MELNFRLLEPEDIEVRISQINDHYVNLLLYKNARVDMAILDETVGAMSWKREHTRDNANCIVSIYDAERGEWVSKEDTGTESYTEAAKGLASDSFKRACVNWGIGRELYTTPDLSFRLGDTGAKVDKTNKLRCYDKFVVTEIEYDDMRRVTRVVVLDVTTGKQIERKPFTIPKTPKSAPNEQTKVDLSALRNKVYEQCKTDGINHEWLAAYCKQSSIDNITENQLNWLAVDKNWNKVKNDYVKE